jgi:hypothetical protein
MLKQKQIQKITFADLTALTASTLNTPEFAYITSENAFYTKIAGVNTLIDSSKDDWSLTGNAGTIAGTNFIGTTDNVDVTIRKNNLPELIVKGNGIFTVNNNNKRNLFIQYGNTTAGNNTLTGEYNGVIGGAGLNALTTGSYNGVIFGAGMNALTSGVFNGISCGYGLYALTTGSYNGINNGYGLYALTTGNFNGVDKGFGLNALTTGSFNGVDKGYGLLALTTGSFNGVDKGVGLNALTTGDYNGVDKGAGLNALTTGSYNGIDKGTGLNALKTGDYNGVDKGYGLESLTTGSYNGVDKGVGLNSLNIGSYNGVDKGAGLRSLTTGSFNGVDKGYGLLALTNNSNVTMIGENNDLLNTSILNIPYANLTFTNATKTYTAGGTINGSTITGASVTSIIASNIAAGRLINTSPTLDADKQTLPVFNSISLWTTAWAIDANTLFVPISNITSGITSFYTSPPYNNIFMVGRNIRATKSNQFIIGGEGATEVKFRGEAGYNYAHDVSEVLTSADDGKVWMYEDASSSIKMKTISTYADVIQTTGANGTETGYDKVVILTNPVTRTLASATGSNTSGKKITYRNISTGIVTIIPSGTELINGVNASISVFPNSAVTLEITGSSALHTVQSLTGQEFDAYSAISPADASTASIDYGYKSAVYQSISAPNTMTLTHLNSKVGAIHHIAISPTGASSTVTFQTGRFTEGGSLVAPKTISTYTVFEVLMKTATSGEIVNTYQPLLTSQVATRTASYTSLILPNTEVNVNIPITGMTTATGRAYATYEGTKPFGLIVFPVQIFNGSVGITIANYQLTSITPSLNFKVTITSL